MFRGGNHLKNYFTKRVKVSHRLRNARGLSTTPSNPSRQLAIAGAVVLASGVATVGAAWQMPTFRKKLEQTAPPVKFLLDPILGPMAGTIVVNKPVTASKNQNDVFESSLKKVRKQEEKSKMTTKSREEDASPLSTEESAKIPLPPPPEAETLPQEDGIQESFIALTNISEDDQFPDVPVPVVEPPTIEESIQKESQETSEESHGQPITAEAEMEEIGLESPTLPQRTPEEIEDTLIKLEEEAVADEAAVSAILGEALSSCATHCSEAIESNNEAAIAISLHTSLLQNAMDETKESAEDKQNQWTDLSRVLEQKSRLQSEAESLSQAARQELSKLDAIILELKKSKNPNITHLIIDAAENCNAMRKELDETAREVNVKISESHVISQYKDLIDTAKEQFRQELLSVMPDVKVESGWRKLSQKLTQDDLNTLIAHAHRRVDQLQRELAEERAISTSRMDMAVQAARERWEQHTAAEMEKTVELLRRESEVENDRKLEEARQVFESEMRVQLKRQAAAHSEHLTDILGIQEKQIKNQLGGEFRVKLNEQEQKFFADMEDLKSTYEEELHEISDKFQLDLNKALATVAGIETVVDGRAYVENESRKAQELWLASEALRISVQYGENGKPVPLQKELQAIAQVPGIEMHVVEIVKAFPEKACERGVFTEEALQQAYKQVSKMCRRLSLIDETRNSFIDYFLSYLKSLLIINRAQTEPPQDLDPKNLDTFTVLSYATYCLEHGDLERAARFLNQLTGESRRVADGWLQEARLLLETRQIVDVLSSFASAKSIAANLET